LLIQNIQKITVGIANEAYIAEADYVRIASGQNNEVSNDL